MTEEQAHTKWCPMVRTGLVAGMAVNHHVSGDVHEETRCIASDCMMWRWEYGSKMKQDSVGWCGLAGKPNG